MSNDANITLGIDGRPAKKGADDIDRALDKIDRSANKATRSLDNVDSAAGAAAGKMKGLAVAATALAASFLTREVVRYSDSFTRLSTQIQNVTNSAAEYNREFDSLFASSQRNGQELASLVKGYNLLNVSLPDVIRNQTDLAKTTEIIARGFAVSGTAAQTASGAFLQLTQGLSTNFQAAGQELNSIIEGAPLLAKTIAEQLGGNAATDLKLFAQQGKLTAETFLQAVAASEKALAAFEIPKTVEFALVQLDNAFLKFIGTSNSVESAASALAESISFLAVNFDSLATIAVSTAAVFASSYVTSASAATVATIALKSALIALPFVAVGVTIAAFSQQLGGVEGLLIALGSAFDRFALGIAQSFTAIGGFARGLVRGLENVFSQITDIIKAAGADLADFVVNPFGERASNLETVLKKNIGDAFKGGFQSGIDEANAFNNELDAVFEEKTKKRAGRIKELLQQQAKAAAIPVNSVTSGTQAGGGAAGNIEKAAKAAEKAARKTRELSEEQRELQRVFDATRTPAEKLAIEFAKLESLRPFAKTPEQIDAINRAMRDLGKEADQTGQIFKDFATDIGGGFTDLFQNIFTDGISGIKDFSNSFFDIFKRMLGRLATAAITQPVIIPIVQSVGGALGVDGRALDSIARELGGTGGGGGIGNLSSLSNLTSGLPSLTNFLSGNIGGVGAINQFGARFLGTGLNTGGIGAGTAGITGGATLSGIGLNAGIGGLISGVLGLGSGNGIIDGGLSLAGSYGGSALAGALGAGSFAGPAGIIGAVALSALGGAFGGGRPRPASNFGTDGFTQGGGLGDVGLYSKHIGTEFAKGLSDTLQNSTSTLAQLTGLNLSNLGAIEGGSDDGRGFLSFGGNFKAFDPSRSVRFNPNNEQSTLQGVSEFLLLIAKNAGNASEVFSNDLIPALDRIQTEGRDTQAVLADISFIAGFDNIAETMTQTADRTTEFEKRIIQLQVNFDSMREATSRLGLSMVDLESNITKVEAKIRQEFNQTVSNQIADQAGSPLNSILQEVTRYTDQLREAQAIGGDIQQVEILHQLRMKELISNNNTEQVTGLRAQAQSTQALVTSYQRIAETLRSTIDGLNVGGFSTLSPLGRLQESQRQFDSAFSRALGGDTAAAGNLSGLANNLLGQGQGFFASSEDFARLQKDTIGKLEQVEASAISQVDVQSGILAASNRQIEVLERGFDSLSLELRGSLLNNTVKQLAAARGDTVNADGTISSSRGTFGAGNFNEQIVALFGEGLVGATEAVRGQILSIISQTAQGVTAGNGGFSRFFENNAQSNDAAIRLAREFGIAGFQSGGRFSGTGLVGERGAEFMTTNTIADVIPYQQNRQVVQNLAQSNQHLQAMVRTTAFGFQQLIDKMGTLIDLMIEGNSNASRVQSGKRKAVA